jgi:hypothetical protein
MQLFSSSMQLKYSHVRAKQQYAAKKFPSGGKKYTHMKLFKNWNRID